MKESTFLFEESAYVSSIHEALRSCLEIYESLFLIGEREIISSFLELSRNESILLCRLFFRKVSWLKTNSFSQYLDIEDFLPTFDELVVKKFLQEFLPSNDIQMPDVVLMLYDCLNTDDLKKLCRIMNIRCNSCTKEDMIEMILISLNSQKAMFFSSSWHRIFPSIRKVMETYGNEKIVRVHPLVSQCVRRCQRLFHVKELIGFHFAYLNLKTAFGIYIQISSFSFQDIGRSIFNTPVYNTSLLVKFRKIRFAPYAVGKASSDLFDCRTSFLKWESSQELLFLIQWMLDLRTRLTKEEGEQNIPANQQRKYCKDMITRCQINLALILGAHYDGESINFLRQDLDAIVTQNDWKVCWDTLFLRVSSVCISLFNFFEEKEKAAIDITSDFLLQFCWETIFRSVLFQVVEYFEKSSPLQSHIVSISILEGLLASQNNKYDRRCGKWYIRLCIDYSHLKCFGLALKTAYAAIHDSRVMLGDRLNLSKKLFCYAEKCREREFRVVALRSMNIFRDFECTNFQASFKSVLAFLEEQCTITDSNLVSHSSVSSLQTTSTDINCYEMKVLDVMKCNDSIETSSKIQSSSLDDWDCSRCTFINTKTLQCQMCGFLKPFSGPKSNNIRKSQVKQCTVNISKESGEKSEFQQSKMVEIIDLIDDEDDDDDDDEVRDVGNKDCNTLVPKSISKNVRESCEICNEQTSVEYRSLYNQVMAMRTNPVCQTEAALANGFNFTEDIDYDDEPVTEMKRNKKKRSRKSSSSSRYNGKETGNKFLGNNNPFEHENENENDNNDISTYNEGLGRVELQRLGIMDYFDNAMEQNGTDSYCWTLPMLKWKPKAFVISGMRFGDRKRKGKSRFVDINDELISVEEYVMQQLENPEEYHDSFSESQEDGFKMKNRSKESPFDLVSWNRVVDGGHWQGWHAESSIINTLFSIVMFEVLFNLSDENEKDSIPINTDLSGVFLCPFQDKPLDLSYPSFYNRREERIHRHLEWIASLNHDQLLSFLGQQFRKYYRCQCRGLNWKFSLATLQLIAACLGGLALSAICRAMSVAHRHFQSGFPDLFLVRIKKIKFEDPCEQSFVPLEDILGDTWQSLLHVDCKEEQGVQEEVFNEKNEDRSIEDDGIPSDNKIPLKKSNIFDCSQEDLQLPEENIYRYEFECRILEVKGPTDHLSDKQVIWLCVLASARVNSFVARVCEKM